jgi:hypothetical protein
MLAMVVLSACSTSPQGRKQLTTPAPISAVYSDVDMRIQLATVANATCIGAECPHNREFDQQVQRLGNRLAESAFETHPDLNKRISHFEFVVAEKEKPGTASNASGTVVIFRGVQKLGLDDEALAFLIAREMGHVICQHHNENSSARILVSVLASVLFPAINLLHGSAALANVTSATTTTTAASTATSFIGSQVVVASIKPAQLNEADTIAMGLLSGLGWNGHDVSGALEACTQVDGDDTWAKDFRISVRHVKAFEEETGAASVNLKAKPLDFQVAHDTTQKSTVRSTLIDTPVEYLKVELNGEPYQTLGEGIKTSEAAGEPVPDASKIVVNAARSDIRLDDTEAVTETSTSVSSDMGNAAFTAASVTSGSEGVKIIADKDATLKENEPSAARGVTNVPASGDAKLLEIKDVNQETSKGAQADVKLPKKSRLTGIAINQGAKVNVQKGTAKKITSGGKLNIKGGKGVSQAAKFRSSKVSIAGKQENIKKTPVNKGSKLMHGRKEPKHRNAKSARATSGAKQEKQARTRTTP